MGSHHGRGELIVVFFGVEVEKKREENKTYSNLSSLSLPPPPPQKTNKQGTGFAAQVYELSTQFLPKEWIMEKWEDGFYITAMAGAASGASLVVMSKGTPYTQQSYKVSDSFPFKWINKKWKEGFYVTSMATSHTR